MLIERDEISIREFSTWTNTSGKILKFLKKNSKKAFTPRGIAKRTKISYKNVQTTLLKLKKKGLVKHNPPYWACTSGRLTATPRKVKKRGQRVKFPTNTRNSILNAIRSGKSSYTRMAKKHHVDKGVIIRLCREHGVESKFKGFKHGK